MRILFVGGGSIGHVAPALAVWRALERQEPTAVMHFVCSEREEDAVFLEEETIPFTALYGRRFSPLRPDRFLMTLLRAKRLLRRFQPDVIFSKGGALSVPVCLAARKLHIPIVLHESDAVMGKANRVIAGWAKTVCTGFPDSRTVFTGNPVRPSVTTGNRERGLSLTGLTGEKPILIVMGGSQGATALNDAIAKDLDAILQVADVIHLTGKGKENTLQRPGYWSRAFAHEELPDLYAIASLALSRSGAGSISELAACGIPALLVPLRGLAQDHQLHNATKAAQSSGCRLLPQDSLSTTLIPTITQLIRDPQRRTQMSSAIRTLFVPDAADRIASLVREAMRKS